MNRKGISYIVKVAMAGILIVVMVIFLWNISKALTGFGVEQQCKSVLTTGGILQFINPNAPIKSALPSQQFEKDISICPINTITYKKRTNPQLIIEDVSNEMVSCYQKYGRGEINLFEQMPGRNIYCVMCTYIEFDNVPGPIDGLTEYMNEEEMRGFGVTYAEFLAGATTSKRASGITIPSQAEIVLDTDKNYSIYFVYAKTRDFWDNQLGNSLKTGTTGFVGGTAAGIGVVIIGSASLPAALIIVPVVAIVGGTIGFFSSRDAVPDEFTGSVMITEYNADIIRQLGCTTYGAATN